MYWLLFNLTQSRDTWKFSWAITSFGLDYGHVCGAFSCFMDWYGRTKPTVVGVTICQVFLGIKESRLNKLCGVVSKKWSFMAPASVLASRFLPWVLALAFFSVGLYFCPPYLLSPFSPVTTTNSKLGYYANSLLIFFIFRYYSLFWLWLVCMKLLNSKNIMLEETIRFKDFYYITHLFLWCVCVCLYWHICAAVQVSRG